MQAIPAPLPRLDAERFRRELAGLIDDAPQPERLEADFKEMSAALCVLLARHYDPNAKDRLQLWEHISKSLALACAKVSSGDLDMFVSLCLDAVRADHGQVVANEQSQWLIGCLTEREESWRLGFIRYIQTHSYVVLVHGRRLWEMDKEDRASRKSCGAQQKAGAV